MIINVKVIANASESLVIGFENEILKIKCTETPEKGKANKAVIALLSKYYKVPKSHIKIIKGKSSSKKIVEIDTAF